MVQQVDRGKVRIGSHHPRILPAPKGLKHDGRSARLRVPRRPRVPKVVPAQRRRFFGGAGGGPHRRGMGLHRQERKAGHRGSPGSGQAQFNSRFSEGLVAVNFQEGEGGAKWGFIDKSGAVVINPHFDSDYYSPPWFSEGLAAISFAGKVGYVDRTGKIVIEPRFAKGLWFS